MSVRFLLLIQPEGPVSESPDTRAVLGAIPGLFCSSSCMTAVVGTITVTATVRTTGHPKSVLLEASMSSRFDWETLPQWPKRTIHPGDGLFPTSGLQVHAHLYTHVCTPMHTHAHT